MALLVGVGLWVVLGAALAGGSVAGVLSLLSGSALSFLAGRLSGRLSRVAGLTAAVVVAIGLGIWSLPDILSHRPLGRPFGYENATAAFFVQACACALALAVVVRRLLPRSAAIVAVASFAAVPFAIDSLAGAILAPAVIVVGVGPWGRLRPRAVSVALTAAFAAVLLGTVVLGMMYPRGSTGPVAAVLTQRRLQLWDEAVDLARREPLFGVGLGAFDRLSPSVRANPDTPSAHQAFLHLAAEGGIPAGSLLAGLFVWAIMRCGRGSAATQDLALRAIAAASISALGIHACVDHVLDVGPVPMMATFLLGVATVRSRMNDEK